VGVITVKTGGQANRIFVKGGFADVGPAGLTVLAEKAIPVAELHPDHLAQDIRDAEEDVADAKTPHARQDAEARLSELKAVAAALRG
jgi:F-type H+-transporting ATPase subunit epsilon